MQCPVVLFNPSRQFFQQFLGLVQLLPSLFFEVLAFLFPGILLFLFYLFLVELSASVFGTDHALKVVMAVLLVKSDCCVSLLLLVLVVFAVGFAVLHHQL